jgi:hypothetical protein
MAQTILTVPGLLITDIISIPELSTADGLVIAEGSGLPRGLNRASYIRITDAKRPNYGSVI